MTTYEKTDPSSRQRLAVRLGVYAMLVCSAGAAFLLHDRLWHLARIGSLPVWAPMVPVVTFSAFVIVYAVDRFLLVRRHDYPMVRAMFQVGLAIVFLTLLWPPQAQELQRARHDAPTQELAVRLLTHRDAEVRAAACELVGLRSLVQAQTRVADMAAHDDSPTVRKSCEESLTHLGTLVP